MTRRYTNKLLEMVDDGELDARAVLLVALSAMSEAEVESIARDDYGIDLDEEDEDEEEEDEDEDEEEDEDDGEEW